MVVVARRVGRDEESVVITTLGDLVRWSDPAVPTTRGGPNREGSRFARESSARNRPQPPDCAGKLHRVTSSTPTPQPHAWDRVRFAETNPQAFRARVDSELQRGRREYQRLPDLGLLGPKWREMQESPRNRARFERISDFVVPGESVVEVGCGSGYVGCLLYTSPSPRD